MSGHSKWSNIKFRKERQDAKKSKIFSQIARDVTIAARLGGADADTNPRLRIALQSARSANMPKDNIERAIKKGTGELGGKMEEFTLEGYGPQGVAMLIEILTDNRNRAISEIRSLFNKANAKMAESGGVKWMFSQIGKIVLALDQEKNKDELELAIIESSALDYKIHNDNIVIYTNPGDLDKIRQNLEDQNIAIGSLELIYKPQNPQAVDNETEEKIANFTEELENLEDVSNVYLNLS